MWPASAGRSVVLCLAFLTLSLFADFAGAGDEPDDGLALLRAGQEAADGGDRAAAVTSFLLAADRLLGTPHRAERVAALAAAARLQADAGDLRAALVAWTTAMPLADALIATEDPDAELALFVRLQVVGALRPSDPTGAERFAWEAVQVAAGTGRLASTAAPVAAVVGSAEDEAGLRERLVELDEVLSALDAYRFHSLARPLPVGWLVHDVGRQLAEAGSYEDAAGHFQLAVRGWLALDAPDLAAAALVDLGRAWMELGDLEGSVTALHLASWLADGEVVGRLEILAEVAARAGDDRGARAIWTLLVDGATEADGARYASLLAQQARVSPAVDAIALHRRAARAFRAAGEPSLALGEVVAAAGRAALLASDATLQQLLDEAAGALAGQDALVIPQLTEATRQLAIATLAARCGEVERARLALSEAGAIQFRVGATEAVAWTASQFVDVALAGPADEALDAAAAALANAEQLERDLGLGLDGWAALAARARLELARGDTAAAEAAWVDAGRRIGRLAMARQLGAGDGIPTPQEAVHAPWAEWLVAQGRLDEAFAVALAAGPMPTRSIQSPERRAAIGALRIRLAEVSTTAGVATPEVLRDPLLALLDVELAALAPPQCGADAIRGLLRAGEAAYLRPASRAFTQGFLVTPGGVIGVPGNTTAQRLRRLLRRSRDLLEHAGSNTDLRSRGRHGAPRFGDDLCNVDWLRAEPAPSSIALPDWRERAAALVWGE